MDRETAVNYLIGISLILVCAIPFFVIYLVGRWVLGLQSMFPVFAHYGDSGLYIFMSLGLLVSLARTLRKHLWKESFVYFAALWMLSFHWFSPKHPFDFLITFVPISACISLPQEKRLSRANFLRASAMIAICAALTGGLFGSGHLAGLAQFVIAIGVVAWSVDYLRRSNSSSEPSLESA